MIKYLPIKRIDDDTTDVVMDVNGDEIQLMNGAWVQSSLWEVDVDIASELLDYFIDMEL